MNTTIIKFNSLPDAIGTRTKNYYFFLIASFAFVLTTAFKSGVEIWCLCFKLCAAGINHFKHPGNAMLLSQFIYLIFCSVIHYAAELLVTKAHGFGFPQ